MSVSGIAGSAALSGAQASTTAAIKMTGHSMDFVENTMDTLLEGFEEAAAAMQQSVAAMTGSGGNLDITV